MINRRELLALLGGAAAATLAGGCTPAPGPRSPSDAPSSPAPAAPGLDLLALGEARRVVDALCKAADSTTLVKLALSRTDASIAVATRLPDRVQDWAWRDGGPQLVDGDTRDVGQARFDPADFRLENLRTIFALAAVVSGSGREQELQVVDHGGARVLMSVTTQPESVPVFFRPDGSLIRQLDYTWPPDLAPGLRDAVIGLHRVTAIGLTPGLGMWAELAGAEAVLRQIRGAKVPLRAETREETSPLREWSFDPDVVRGDVLVDVATRLRGNQPLALAIDRRNHHADPVLRFTVGQRTVATDVTGRDITAELRGR